MAICARRFRDFRLVVEDWTPRLNDALKVYRRLRNYPEPPRDLLSLSEDAQVSLLCWRTWQLKFGYPLQDLLFHGLQGLVPEDLRISLVGRGDPLAIGIPMRVFISERPYELLSARLRPVSQHQRIRAAAGMNEKTHIPDVYSSDQRVKGFARVVHAQNAEADRFELTLKRYGIVIDPFA